MAIFLGVCVIEMQIGKIIVKVINVVKLSNLNKIDPITSQNTPNPVISVAYRKIYQEKITKKGFFFAFPDVQTLGLTRIHNTFRLGVHI